MRFILLISLAVFYFYACHAWAQTFETNPILTEDFTHGIDTQTWKAADGVGRNAQDPKGEKQYYTPQALHTDAQGLHIVAQRVTDPQTNRALEYTSGELDSRHAFLYGRFEFRARLPKGDGFWPALWLYTPPWQGEIDVIEGFGNHPKTVQSTLHIFANGIHSNQRCARIGMPEYKDCLDATVALGGNAPDFTADYHVFTLEWLPDHIMWFLDGKPYYVLTHDVPKTPMIIVLNLAVSGGGFVDAVTPQTPFPAAMDVASVKVWALQQPK